MPSSAQDPFYIVKEEIQESIDKLQSAFHQWECIPSDSGEQIQLTRQLLANCESIGWQVDELDKTVSVAARDPSFYGIDEVELEKRRRWTTSARTQVANMKKTVVAGNGSGSTSVSGTRRELLRMPDSHHTVTFNQYSARDNDDFIGSESDRQMLLIKQQDEDLDELTAGVERIGSVGRTIHEELLAQARLWAHRLGSPSAYDYSGIPLLPMNHGYFQHEVIVLFLHPERILDELGTEMDGTSNRLDFVQKKVGMVMKKAGIKGQMMMILFLVVLFIILFVLVFLT